jgi:uncharacterized membrane protein YkgB
MKNFQEKLEHLDQKIISWSRKYTMTFSRLAIFIVYFWFGILKVFGASPAGGLVTALLAKISFLNGIDPVVFVAVFGMLEVVIGILFLIPHLERFAVFALFLHMIAIFMPLILLPLISWQGFLIPTLEGQYIIKNVLLIALGINILSNLGSLKEKVNHV